MKLCRLTLHKHYSTRMSSDGFKAFFSHPPVIYLTSNTYQETMQLVCKQLGLPASTIRLLRIDEGEEKEALKVVEAAFEEDKAAGKLPIMCVANVHSSLVQVRESRKSSMENPTPLLILGQSFSGHSPFRSA